MILRPPREGELASPCPRDEIALYEGYLEKGVNVELPALLIKVANHFAICPSQLNPPSWRILTAFKVLNNFYGFDLGIEELLYCYYFFSISSSEGCYYFHPRVDALIVKELDKDDRKGVAFSKPWTQRFLFMKVGLEQDYLLCGNPLVTMSKKERGRDPNEWHQNEGATEGRRPQTKKQKGISTRSTSLSPYDLDKTLEQLKIQVFPTVDTSYSGLEFVEVLYYLQKKMLEDQVASTGRVMVEDYILKLKAEKDMSSSLEKELKEIKNPTRELESMNQKESDRAQMLIEEKAALEKKVIELKAKVDTFAEEMAIAINTTKILGRWEMARD